MKKFLSIVPVFLFSLLGFSQGIVFEQGTWKEVLVKAQQADKPIFVELYTSYSDSCKQMAEQIFSVEAVGKVYNGNFICYQIDAEKGEGIEFAKLYEVKSYPTYLFFNTNGAIFCKASKAMSAKNLIGVSDQALAIMYDSKSMDVMEKEYAVKKDDPAFLKWYIWKRSNIGLSNAFLFDKYLKLIPEEERTSATVVNLYKEDGKFLRVNSLAFKNLQKYSSKFDQTLGAVNLLIFTCVRNTIGDAAESKDEKLLDTAMSVYDQLPQEGLPMQKDELFMMYYNDTEETGKYLKHTAHFCNKYLMKISNDTIEQRNKANVAMFDQMVKSGVFSSIKDAGILAKLKDQSAHSESIKISNELNSLSNDIFESSSDKKLLKNALKWSERSLELSPDNVQLMETYANLLYKLGLKKEAIAKEEDALKKLPKVDANRYRMEGVLVKMKAGEKTW
ncbi:MAG: thioredoxin family protein [Bacteroidales bacterium]|nr:thioredoxin family protein [Bacteroidales bacterium]